MNEALRNELLALRAHDEETRGRLAQSGELFDGYNAQMEAVHIANAEALTRIVDEHGWPGHALVGAEAAEAAWLVAQHAISSPQLQLRCLELLAEAAEAGEAPAWQLAYLADRIRINSQQQQIFGTQFDWDEQGELSPYPIEAEDEVDERRAEVGLKPLAEAVELARERAGAEGHRPPAERQASQRRQQEWARRVGWIE